MTVILHVDHGKRTDAYNLTRYRDQNGKMIELRKNNIPRGCAFKRMHNIQWSAMADNLDRVAADCRRLLQGFNS